MPFALRLQWNTPTPSNETDKEHHRQQLPMLPMTTSYNASDLNSLLFVSQEPLTALDFRLEPTSPVFSSVPHWQQIPRGFGPRKKSPLPVPVPSPSPWSPPQLLPHCGDVFAIPDPPDDEAGPTLLYIPPTAKPALPSGSSTIGTLLAAGQGNNVTSKKVHLLMARSVNGGTISAQYLSLP